MVAANKEHALDALFGKRKVAIGVVHLPALPGSPGYQGDIDDVYAQALQDAERYVRGGIDGLIIENHGDIPFAKPEDIGYETVAAMAVISSSIRKQFPVPMGINVLANAALPALAVAQAAGAQFVRVNQWANAYVANEGFIEGPAAKASRYRAMLRASHIRFFTDVHVKHGAHAITADRSLAELTRDVEFFDADAAIATGQRTGDSADTSELQAIRDATSLPLLVGSGVRHDNIAALLELADGVIIASALKEEGVWWTPVSLSKVKAFMQQLRTLRGELHE